MIQTAEANLRAIQEEIKRGDDNCYALWFKKCQIELEPFKKDLEKSRCKITQDEFQKKNSELYRHWIAKARWSSSAKKILQKGNYLRCLKRFKTDNILTIFHCRK